MTKIPGYNIEIPSDENIRILKEQCDYLYDIQGNLEASAVSFEYAMNNDRYSAWFQQTETGKALREKILANCEKLKLLDNQISGLYQTIESLVFFCNKQ